MRKSNTQLTLAALRAEGALCDIAEHWNAFAHVRKDLFGFIDIVAINSDGIRAIQTCSGVDLQKRKRKICANPYAKRWIRFAGIEVWAWRKLKKVRGGKTFFLSPIIYRFSIGDFNRRTKNGSKSNTEDNV